MSYQCTIFLYKVGWLLYPINLSFFIQVFGANVPMPSQAAKFMEVYFGPMCPVFVLFYFNSDFITKAGLSQLEFPLL